MQSTQIVVLELIGLSALQYLSIVVRRMRGP
jgi:hypothetical protein